MARTEKFNDEGLKTFVNELISKYNSLKHFEAFHNISYSGLDGSLIYDTEDFFRIAKLFEAEIKEEKWESENDIGFKYRYSMKIRDVEFATYTLGKEEFE